MRTWYHPGSKDGPLVRFLPALMLVGACVLYFQRLDVPQSYVFDESYHAYTAAEYLAGNADAFVWYGRPSRAGVGYTWNHPPLGLLLISTGIGLFGDRSFGWRFASAVFGAAGIMLTYLLALSLTRSSTIALCASSLLLLDGLYFVQARIAMLDIFGTVFLLAAFLALHRYLTAPPDRVRGPLLFTGTALGLALATKWNALYPAALIGAVISARMLGFWRGGKATQSALRQHVFWVPVALVALPLAIYLAAYIPFFAVGHDLTEFLELPRQILAYHEHLTAGHTYQSPWWQWPLAVRSAWYYVAYGPGTIANIYALGNPVLYWAFLPAVAWLSWSWWRRRDPAVVVLLIGFFGQWLPWALVSRITFVYYFLPAVPFGALAVAAGIVVLWESGTWRRPLAATYLALVALAFVFFHPVHAAVPLTREQFESRIWFESWR
jgi:dolichyl-phosphate-mannose-protein mannosyltransferase